MKKTLTILALALTCAVGAFAKEQTRQVETFTVSPAMHCENCEKKIKSNLRFEKGDHRIIGRDVALCAVTIVGCRIVFQIPAFHHLVGIRLK